jgi:hypothetical protein
VASYLGHPVNVNLVLPLTSSILAFVFALMLFDQWRDRQRPYQLSWAIGMIWFGIGAGVEFIGGVVGWNVALYKVWYLVGAILTAGWLGLGTIYLLRHSRFGYAFAIVLVIAGLYAALAQANFRYANSGPAPLIYLGAAIALAIDVVVLTYLRSDRWADVTGAVVVTESIAAAVLMVLAPVPAPGYFLDANGLPVADGFPGYLRLLSPLFSVSGALALILGAAYSAYSFMPKRRLIDYHRSSSQSGATYLANLAVALIAVPVNLIASVPGAFTDLFRGRLDSRVPATVLIALGATIASIGNGQSRFGDTSAHYAAGFLAVVLLFLGYLVSIDALPVIRVPFTRWVLRERRIEA